MSNDSILAICSCANPSPLNIDKYSFRTDEDKFGRAFCKKSWILIIINVKKLAGREAGHANIGSRDRAGLKCKYQFKNDR